MIFDLETLKKALQLSPNDKESTEDAEVFTGLSLQEILSILNENSDSINPSE